MADEPEVPVEPVVDPLATISANDIIPDEFKGRDPAEIRLLMSQMPKIVQAQKQELENLRIQMAGGGAPTVTHGPPATPAAPALTPEQEKAAFEELFDSNPKEAIRQFVVGEFGDRFTGVESRLGATDLALVKSQVKDFHEYEEDVSTLLRSSGAPATQQNIMGAYAMAVGQRTIQKQQQLDRMEQNPLPVTPAPDPDAQAPKLTPLQDQVREQMGLTPEEFTKYSGDESFALNIRT